MFLCGKPADLPRSSPRDPLTRIGRVERVKSNRSAADLVQWYEMAIGTDDPTSRVEIFAMEEWTVDPQRHLVSNGETSVHLEPKAVSVLVCLVEHAGSVVSRRTIIDRVWATEFIADSTLTHTVADIRKALGDDSRSPRFIETIPKKGYRLMPEAHGFIAPTAPTKPAAPRPPMVVIAGGRVRAAEAASAGPIEHVLCIADREIPLSRTAVIFGRDQSADVQILEPEVSRNHARLEIARDKVQIEDLGSKNGTRVNDQGIAGRHELSSGDVIEIGATTMTYCHRSDDPTSTQDEH